MVRVLLCASGSVAGIKVPELAEALQGGGHDVRVLVTPHGATFVAKAPAAAGVEALCPLPRVYTDTDRGQAGDALEEELWAWADALVIAPLSANTLAKLALGLCDNLVTRVARGWDVTRPLLLAPAMNTKMWEHAATASHLDVLRAFGARVVDPVAKKLACGDVGVGAMATVSSIVEAVDAATGRISAASDIKARDCG